ncbi:SdpI family protein [Altererythrobacter lutimaris]|nr:SdpI family protein [Altererythrobacter lutimaris]
MVVVAAMVVFAFIAESRLPAGTELPIHWNAAGVPDDFAPALQALLLSPAILAGASVLFWLLPSLEPLQNKLEGSAPLLKVSWLGIILLMCILQAVVGLPAFGIEMPINAVLLGVGLLFLLIGNALPKSRPGFFVGIRTPWTITDTDNWIATHRLGGKLFMLAGAIIAALSLVPGILEMTAVVVVTAVLFAAFVPLVYSWWFWRTRAKTSGGDRP